jgi:hypothetical protein
MTKRTVPKASERKNLLNFIQPNPIGEQKSNEENFITGTFVAKLDRKDQE